MPPAKSAQKRMEEHKQKQKTEKPKSAGSGMDLTTIGVDTSEGQKSFLDLHDPSGFDPKNISLEQQMTFIDQAGVGRLWMKNNEHLDKSFFWGSLKESYHLILAGVYALVDATDERFKNVPRKEFNYHGGRYIARFGDPINVLMWTGKEFALAQQEAIAENYRNQFRRKVEKSEKSHDIGIVAPEDMPGATEGIIREGYMRAVDPVSGDPIDEDNGGMGRILGTD